MILSSTTADLNHSLMRKRRSQHFHPEECHDINQNIGTGLPSTSYRRSYIDECCLNSSLSSEHDFSFSSSPSRLPRGSTRSAFSKIYGKDAFEFIDPPIGEGFYGKVYKVRTLIDDPDLPETLVMKCLKITSDIKEGSKIKRETAREAEILLKLKHPNVLAFRGLCVDRGECKNGLWALHLVVDYCDAGTLQQLIVSPDKPFPWFQKFLIATDIANAMQYINSQGYMHRDLTSHNILLQSVPKTKHLKAVVADFGLAIEIPKPGDQLKFQGSTHYESPEMLREKPYNEKTDVFSFGIILCQMIARIDSEQLTVSCRNKDFGINFAEFAKLCSGSDPKPSIQIAAWCCSYKPEERPSFEELHKILEMLIHRWKG